VLATAGLRVPTTWLPWGFDPGEFGPAAKPIALPVGGRYVFLHAAAANPRKGTDVLVDAFLAEFNADDPVALVVKEAPRHPTWARWADRVERRARSGGGPPILWLGRPARSLSPYFARADVGVFPHRGEGFGLPILECLASGRRVIVTNGTGPDSFCSEANAWSIRTWHVRRHGRVECEPDRSHLRVLLRQALERGRPARRDARAVARTVAGWTWARTVERLDTILRDALAAKEKREVRVASGARRPAPAVAYAFHSLGTTSWKQLSAEIDRSLRGRFTRYRAHTVRDSVPAGLVDVVVGQSQHCVESILAVRRRNPCAVAIVHQEATVLGDRLAIVNRERERCGVPPVRVHEIDFWRSRQENQLADAFVVASRVAQRCFVANGFDQARVHVVPLGVRSGPLHVRARARTTRFLFVGTDPFRKGIRLLFAAWERADLPDAELICHVDLEVLTSRILLGYLVRNPGITVLPLLPHRLFRRRYRDVDCQVLPSLEDTFSLTVAEGMGVGKPAIVSDATGVADLITHGVDGQVVPAGDTEALAAALTHLATDRTRMLALGAEAHATARQYSWRRFRATMGDLVQSIWEAGR
jgi:glycosyltransferase involved in cell wall biosynthesis